MNEVSADLSLREALAQAKGLTEVRDENGILLGYLVSPSFGWQLRDERKAFYAYLNSLTSKEEIERAKNDPKGRSTAELLQLVEGG